MLGYQPRNIVKTGFPRSRFLWLWRFHRRPHAVDNLGELAEGVSAIGVLVMARPATSRKRAVRHTIRRFRDVGVGNIAVVMNDVDHSKFTYHGYGPYYHYRKHYGSYVSSASAENGKDDDIQTGHA